VDPISIFRPSKDPKHLQRHLDATIISFIDISITSTTERLLVGEENWSKK
jgi:hypothetical protein